MPMFTLMDGTALTIDDIKPTGADCDYNVHFELLDSFGRTGETTLWAPGSDVGEEDVSCWQNEDQDYKITGVKFDQGQAIWIAASSDKQGVQSVGQVSNGEFSAPLCNGGTATGNPFPVQITIDDMVPTGDDCDYNVHFEFLDSFGRTGETTLWAPGSDVGEEDVSCWQNEDQDYKITGVPLNPGEGIWIAASSDKQALLFTSKALKDLAK